MKGFSTSDPLEILRTLLPNIGCQSEDLVGSGNLVPLLETASFHVPWEELRQNQEDLILTYKHT